MAVCVSNIIHLLSFFSPIPGLIKIANKNDSVTAHGKEGISQSESQDEQEAAGQPCGAPEQYSQN